MTPEQLIEKAADLFRVDPALILSPCRSAQVVTARYAVIWVLRSNGWTVEAIGDFLGRDHSTICYALETAEERCGPGVLEALRCEITRRATRKPIDWKVRVGELERRLALLESALLDRRAA